MKRTSVALFGLGRIGQIHLENILINPKINLLYICDANVPHAQNVKEKYNLAAQVIGVENFGTVFDDADLDGVIIGKLENKHNYFIMLKKLFLSFQALPSSGPFHLQLCNFKKIRLLNPQTE